MCVCEYIMSGECIVPQWNIWYQRQEEQVEGGSYHVHNHQKTPSRLVHMANYEVTELTWENGQLSMHELGGMVPNTAPTSKAPWGRTGDTLESIVHQATCHTKNINLPKTDNYQTHLPNKSSILTTSSGKWGENSSHMEITPGLAKKRIRSEYSDQCGRNFSSSLQERADRSACGSGSATFCRDNNDTTMMTWASFESPQNLKRTKSADEDSACHDGSENRDEEHETKGETVRSHSTRRSRAAAVHNQSERRRRDRINQKMKALQKLVPNASKVRKIQTDKASMLDEVIDYLKQLQAQVQMMNSVRNTTMPQMMMPIGMQQQQLRMSLLAPMGMGVGLGMNMGMPQSLSSLIHPNPATAATPTFIPQPFVVPSMIQRHIHPQASTSQGTANTSVPFSDPYCAFLAQSMNMELYNKMAAAVYQQVNQAGQATNGTTKSNHDQGE